MAQRTARGVSGFTLIELMIVLILVGIFSALMIGEMRGTFEDALLRSTARKLISAANLANSKAITLNRAHTLRIEPSIIRIEGGEQGESAEEKLDERIHVEVRQLPPTELEQEVPPEAQPADPQLIRFQPDGTADSREILLRDRMGVEVVLRINPTTGRTRIVEAPQPP